MGLSTLSGRTNWVTVQSSGDDDSKFWWRFKVLGMMDQGPVGWRIQYRCHELYPCHDRLSGSNYDAWHMSLFDWIFPWIEASLRLPCTSSIYITRLLSHFSIFSWNTLSERYRHPCQKAICLVAVPVIYIPPPFLYRFGKCSLFTSLFYLQIYIFFS